MDPLLYIASAIVGALIGSFLNVVIHRGPALWGLVDVETARGDFLSPGSYCPDCRTPIPPWRLIPIVSFFAQGGRCAICNAAISPRYVTVEALGLLVALLSCAIFGVTYAALLAAIFGWTLIALGTIDHETGYLPDWLTLPLIPIGILAGAMGIFVSITQSLIGAAVGYGVFRLIAAVFRRLRKKEGLGLGDAKLLAGIGAFVGWASLPAVVLIASVATLAWALLRRGDEGAEIPFGPGLCFAGFIALLASSV